MQDLCIFSEGHADLAITLKNDFNTHFIKTSKKIPQDEVVYNIQYLEMNTPTIYECCYNINKKHIICLPKNCEDFDTSIFYMFEIDNASYELYIAICNALLLYRIFESKCGMKFETLHTKLENEIYQNFDANIKNDYNKLYTNENNDDEFLMSDHFFI
ncbi:hypothetical protein BMW23_0476 [Bodo saltans virus]|uniref:Uncharacterized protein n=1 Tax=Bodo saltans virus TaxID=2024608 RepID=A0A2H4UUE2_9VIRU|nr:hypothetical protein QJ851_gp0465 [Bodo saltans virus]ATZ80528.1 hypothetical protein BMW23_0476 [Bodo saltans virus]